MKTAFKVMLMAVMIAAPAFAETVGGRQWSQQGRINAGVRDGSLNRGEAMRLEGREARIHREILRDRADGRFTLSERARVERQENRVSRSIFRDRHNCR